MANDGLDQSMKQTADQAQQLVPKLSAVANVLKQIGQSADALKALANMGFSQARIHPHPCASRAERTAQQTGRRSGLEPRKAVMPVRLPQRVVRLLLFADEKQQEGIV